ncbi:DUF3592 domain-containing protein [Roseisolibacter sp. H3M3-2]|uniref:DUF3592 domain-containing protein n=1 Tax=Roseisolibacter sp. H3M3-2 TaxID=3031323 RepID=UPI0023D9C2A0|nr:DUF3592 domain-containing protein [Roseisolibacter sp. H3M3-2]MDF1502723.1 DUF3592 domain-containing protein [Roseisolibacter sp. H3M3-2]
MSARPGRVGGFAIPLGLFLLVGVALWGWNAWRLVRGRATPAVVVSSSVATSSGRSGTTYRPAVSYRYVAADSERVGTAVLPGRGEGRGRAWAERIAARFAAGDSTVAYVDPSDPSDAYLVRQPSAGVLLLIAAPLAVIGLLLVDGPVGSVGDPMPPPDPAPAGPDSWVQALRDDPALAANAVARATGRWRPVALGVLGAHLVLVAWCAAGEPGLGDTLAAVWRSTLGDGFFVFDLAALVGAAWYLRRQRVAAARTAARVRGARVMLDRPEVRIGAAVNAALQPMLVRGDAAMRDATLTLERETREGPSGKVRHRDAHPPLDAGGGSGGEATSAATWVLPAHAIASSTRPDETPRTAWAFVARLRFTDGHEATLRFPVRVHPVR